MTGDDAVRWTVRLALALYAAALAFGPGQKHRRLSAWLWAAGCTAFVAHVAAAFHFVHHWSHAAAWQATAVATAEATGVAWGGGILVNYAFTAVWLVDAGWRLIDPNGYAGRPRWIGRAVHVFLAFVAFQGAVVFAAGAIRWISLAFAAALLAWRLSRPPDA